MALAMSPMTAAIMSAVPARRAGVGSAMNDATRELGAALGIAVLGSIAASRYASLDQAGPGRSARRRADRGAQLDRRGPRCRRRPRPVGGDALTSAAHHSFLSGLHVAVLAASMLAFASAVIVYRYLPHHLAAEGALHGPVESLEDAAELGLGGTPPVFADAPTDR